MTLLEDFKAAGLNIRKNWQIQPKLAFDVLLVSYSVRGADSDPDLIADATIEVDFAAEDVDEKAEEQIEEILAAHGYAYAKSREWLSSEKMFQTTYMTTTTCKKAQVKEI